MKNFQLPPIYKKIGIGVALLSFIGLFANKLTVDMEAFRSAARYGLLIGFLLMSISREKIEDELIKNLRMQSYSFAFIFGVIMSLFTPFIDFFVDAAAGVKEAGLKDAGDFEILWILLSVQVLYFEMLKRMHQ